MKRLCSSGTDNLFRCALIHWDTGVVKPGGTVTSRHHLLDIRVGELSLAYQALLVQRGRIYALGDMQAALMSEPSLTSNMTRKIWEAVHITTSRESSIMWIPLI